MHVKHTHTYITVQVAHTFTMAAGWSSDFSFPSLQFELALIRHWCLISPDYQPQLREKRKSFCVLEKKNAGWRPSVNLNYSRVHSWDVLLPLNVMKPNKSVKPHGSTTTWACVSVGSPAVFPVCASKRVMHQVTFLCLFSHPRDFQYSDCIIDWFHWMIRLH